MLGLPDFVGRATKRAASIGAVCVFAIGATAATAEAETRTLNFYHLHTGEKLSIAYKKDGRYIPGALDKINWELRDWRKRQIIKMDPRLLDLIWEAYRQSGSREYIQVVCGYRSPETNNMLRSRSSGVAKESQHTMGRALDFFLPDVPLKKMREIGLKMQVGGVGFYPRSGSPFVHFDVGNARHWPKMSRQELLAVFPNGNTVHVPSDGRPLPGYEQALASYKARKGDDSIQVANAGTRSRSGGRTLFAAIFGGGADEEEDVADVVVAPKAPAPVRVQPAAATAIALAKVPERPAAPKAEIAVAALLPTSRSAALPSGVPLPIREAFDTSAPAPMPPAAVPVQAATRTQIAALDVSRIPLPSFAPPRPGEDERDPQSVASIVAALQASPAGQEIAEEAPAQLAYAVPTPRARPAFDELLKGDAAQVASNAPTSESMDEVRRILENASTVPMPSAPAQKFASLTMPAAAEAAPVPTPPVRASAMIAASSALPASAAGPLAAASRIALPVASAEKPAPTLSQQPMAVAALEAPRTRPALVLPPVAARKMTAVPKGKTGRLVREVPQVATPPKVTQQAIETRIELAALVDDPDRRAQAAMMKKPNADMLVRDVPTSVFTAGFTARPLSNASDRFAGTAVNFLPVAKFD